MRALPLAEPGGDGVHEQHGSHVLEQPAVRSGRGHVVDDRAEHEDAGHELGRGLSARTRRRRGQSL